ncbi:MAG: hypothetical protein WBD95_06465, partial [Xanthobacteraceae bacterium]
MLSPSAYPERPSGTIETSSLGVALGFGGFLIQINTICIRPALPADPCRRSAVTKYGGSDGRKKSRCHADARKFRRLLRVAGPDSDLPIPTRRLSRRLPKQPFALQIDHLPGFAQREG